MMDAIPQTLQEGLRVNGENPFREWLRGLRNVNARATQLFSCCAAEISHHKNVI